MALLKFLPAVKAPDTLSTALACVIIIAGTLITLYLKHGSPTDPREPPIVRTRVPLIGHFVGLLRYKGNYLKVLSTRYSQWPIFTLKTFGSRIYVVSSPELAQSLLCNTKQLSFMPFHIAYTNRAVGARQEIKDMVAVNDGENSYNQALHHALYSALAQGPALVETNSRMMNHLARYFNEIGTSAEPRDLYRWMRDAYTLGFAETFYGPNNPISKNPALIQSVWDFEAGVTFLFLNIAPSITARKAQAARKTIAAAFEAYYEAGLDVDGNAFTKGRIKAARANGWTNNDIAKFEATMCHTGTTNTVPNAFSILAFVLGDRDLAEEISNEVRGVVTRRIIDGVEYVKIDTTALNEKCPTLESAYFEMLRLSVNATSVRVMTEDLTLNDGYHLTKGGIVQIAGGAMHESKKKNLLPFGGGKHLCPGRHLAQTEIMSFAAMVLYGFEVEMRDGSGLVQHPGFEVPSLGQNSKKPVHDVEVLIKRKEEFRDVVWAFET